jgi:hypothetical protein
MRLARSSLLGCCLACVLVVGVAGAGLAQTATNVQDGENSSRTHQAGDASAGQAITGQVVGVSSGGGSSVNATNSTDNSTAQSGDATARNHANTFAGQRVAGASSAPPGPPSVTAANRQTGDNINTVSQSANASTGDGIAGQVIGVATTGGPSSIVASNTTTNSDVFTGDASTDNSATAFAGQSINDVLDTSTVIGCTFFCLGIGSAKAVVDATNEQTGDNSARSSQSSHASTGDGVAGQVIGASTSGGSSRIDARNTSTDVDVVTGDADASNHATMLAGLAIGNLTASATVLGCIALCFFFDTATSVVAATNSQTGDNAARPRQSASASTGDGVAGQIIGAATSGGSSEIVASNLTRRADVTTGDADAHNSATAFAGEDIRGVTSSADAFGCFFVCGGFGFASATAVAANSQTGDNVARASQVANASSGDGVGGQVIGAATRGGSTSVDAANRTEDSNIFSGDADASNSSHTSAGLSIATLTATANGLGCFFVICIPVPGIVATTATNTQVGDNSRSASQAANASSGDAVGGQIIAVSSTGATVVRLSNSTTGTTTQSGGADEDNSDNSFVGLAIFGGLV